MLEGGGLKNLGCGVHVACSLLDVKDLGQSVLWVMFGRGWGQGTCLKEMSKMCSCQTSGVTHI